MSNKLKSDCSSERFDSKMSLCWNDTFWFVDQLNRKKSNLRSFVCARKLFIGGIDPKKVHFVTFDLPCECSNILKHSACDSSLSFTLEVGNLR